MSKNSLILAAIHVSLVLVGGCGASPEDGDQPSEAIEVARQALDPTLISVQPSVNGAVLAYGHCNGDGYVIEGGAISRLGVGVGSDATGITSPGHAACHNTGVWKQGAPYVCNSNQGTHPVGTYKGTVPEFDEWVGSLFVRHPASVATAGLNFAHAQLVLCTTPSHLDYELVSLECCAAPATRTTTP
jgi:hypothetical protein